MNLFEKQTRLNQLFAQSPVNAAYLAGTLSNRATFGHMTDIDVGILMMDQIKADQFFDYQLYFLSELAKRLETDNIDVVILNQASLILKLQVIKNGQILFSRNEKQRVTFETKAVMDYLDFKKFDEIQNQALGRRLYSQMLPIDKDLIEHHLKQLRSSITVLQELATIEREAFVRDYHVYALAERYLQQAIESCLYMCSTLISAFGLRRPEGYHELLSIIMTQQLLPRPLAYRLENLVNLRDDLVHTPEAINHEQIYDILQQQLQDLVAFANTMEQRQG
jgi:uncharacterized protein YutE (UPF0331/DUF86 family)